MPDMKEVREMVTRRKAGMHRVVATFLILTGVLSACSSAGEGSQPGGSGQTSTSVATSTAKSIPDAAHPRSFKGMVIRYTGGPLRGGVGDLFAEDPSTGKVITLVDVAKIPGFGDRRIGFAAASADGRWAAFESPFCQDGITDWNEPGGLWVTNGVDEPRQLTTACADYPNGPTFAGLAWSPTASQLAVVRRSSNGDQLILIDPATADRTDLVAPAGLVTSLAWSPDGSRIAYGTVPVGTGDEARGVRGSVYSVDVSSGDHALLAHVVGEVPDGEEGTGIRWSPDGRRIAVLAGPGGQRARLYLVKADGSGVELITEGVHIEHILGAPNLDWSPDGSRMAYATLTGDRDKMQIWNASPNGSTPVRVFGSPSAGGKGLGLSGDPVWSRDGTQIAFRYDAPGQKKVWLIANADGTGDVHEIDETTYLSWRGGWYFCECYG